LSIVLLPLLLAVPGAAGAPVDPFADVSVASAPARAEARGFFAENFGFRRELMSQWEAGRDERGASRQSIGFEALKKFSSETATWGSVDVQGRLVRRDRFVPAQNEMEGGARPGWYFEYHNVYADLYNAANPILSDDARSAAAGRVNVRAGRFYVPFGLNLRTDTHASVLQLSNGRDFGFERDWYAGLWGNLADGVDYDADYLAGSGYDLKRRGQSGLAAGRLSLSNRLLSDYGLEGGVSYLGGERLSPDAVMRSPAVAADAGGTDVVKTERFGIDGRWRRAVPTGSIAWTSELSVGRDASDGVFTQLHQLDYLRASRRWGLSAQYRRFWQDMSRSRALAGAAAPGAADASLIGEATWYFRNDVASSSLHWIKLNVERQTERALGRPDTIATVQYYRYW